MTSVFSPHPFSLISSLHTTDTTSRSIRGGGRGSSVGSVSSSPATSDTQCVDVGEMNVGYGGGI